MPRTTFYGFKNVQVTIQPNIGLDASARQSVVEMLNLFLADEAVLAIKTHHADESAGETHDPEMHIVFDDQYQQITGISKEIVERIQVLGGVALKGSEALIDTARLAGDLGVVPDIVNILADHEAFIRFLREDARKCSEMYEDQGTFALLVSVMRAHEKMAWILRSNVAPGELDAGK